MTYKTKDATWVQSFAELSRGSGFTWYMHSNRHLIVDGGTIAWTKKQVSCCCLQMKLFLYHHMLASLERGHVRYLEIIEFVLEIVCIFCVSPAQSSWIILVWFTWGNAEGCLLPRPKPWPRRSLRLSLIWLTFRWTLREVERSYRVNSDGDHRDHYCWKHVFFLEMGVTNK